MRYKIDNNEKFLFSHSLPKGYHIKKESHGFLPRDFLLPSELSVVYNTIILQQTDQQATDSQQNAITTV